MKNCEYCNKNVKWNTYNTYVGTSKIHKMTSSRNYKLRVELETFNGEVRYAEYGQFSVGDEDSNFILTIDDYTGNLGMYTLMWSVINNI